MNLSLGSGQSDIGPPLDASVRNLESPDLVSHVLERRVEGLVFKLIDTLQPPWL